MSADRLTTDGDAFHVFAKALEAYLDTNGWGVVVAGATRIVKRPGSPPFKFVFEMEFTGAPYDAVSKDVQTSV